MAYPAALDEILAGMPTEYVTVYQISKSFSDWQLPCIGLLLILATPVIIWGKRRFGWRQPHWFMPIFLIAFGIIWTVSTGVEPYRDNSNALAAYQAAHYSLVEGTVTNFSPMPYEGHRDECFTVQTQTFCYSDYEIVPGFHQSASHGGPIREGLPVRIAYTNSAILRLDVAREGTMPPAQSAAIAANAEKQMLERMQNDPIERRMTIAFLLTTIGWTLWWNLQWKRVMRFWLRPPYKPATQYGFRIFFAANFIGAIIETVQQLRQHPLTGAEIGPTVEVTALMSAVVALMSVVTLKIAERRDRKAAERHVLLQ